MRILFAAACCLWITHSWAQTTFQSFGRDAIFQRKLIEAVDLRYQQDLRSLSGRKYKNEIADIFKQRNTSIKETIGEKEIITDAVAVSYLNSLVQIILTANPQLKKDSLRVLFSRAWWPNAASMGEGTIVFHLGLFNRLENEAQVAFILCHELAHYFLDHGNAAIFHYVETTNSEDFQRRLKEISKSEYNRNNQLEKLGLSFAFNSRRHSRDHEKEADAMAFDLLKNTRYDLKAAVSSLAVLDSVDKDKFAGRLALEQQLNFPGFPFKKRWISGNTLMFADAKEEKKDKAIADSLKTHPDCQLRLSLMEAKLNKEAKSAGQTFLVSQNQFQKLKSAFDYEILEYCFESDQVARTLYFALQMLSVDPKDPYLLSMAGKCLNKLYAAQKEHTLSRIVDLPNPAIYNEEYNSLLKAIQNWRLNEIAAISYYFHQTHADAGKSNEDFVYAMIQSKEHFNMPDEKKEWIQYYHQNFPKRKYRF
jgi:hypothetical protein